MEASRKNKDNTNNEIVDERRKEDFEFEKKHTEERNKEDQNRLKKLFIDTKYESFYIIDFIESSKREELIKNLKKLFRFEQQSDMIKHQLRFNNIPDFTKIGKLLPTGCHFNGYLYNENYYTKPFFLNGPIRDLPDFIDFIEIGVSNYDDKNYCILIKCKIHEDYKKENLKDDFIHKDDFVTRLENNLILNERISKIDCVSNTLNDKIKQLSQYLTDYIEGFYITKDNYYKKDVATPPNIKVLSINRINFSNFKEWELKNREFLWFFDTQYPFYSKKEEFLASIQKTTSFGRDSISSGLIFISSITHVKLEMEVKKKENIIDMKMREIVDQLLPYFYIFHKTNFLLESELPKFENKKDLLKKVALEEKLFYKKDFRNILGTYSDYEDLYCEEKKNF